MNRREMIRLLALSGISKMLPGNMLQANYASSLSASLLGKDFVWGVATAAYQIEGAHNMDGKGPSIWDTFSAKKKNIKDGSNGNIACDFYHRYSSDLQIVKELGFDVFRFSLSWPRLFPQGNTTPNLAGFDFYQRVIDHCLSLGLSPWITLYHWDLPQTLEDKGGWTNRDIVNYFSDYTAACCRAFGNKVKNWIILNEPMGFTSLGYMTGYHAPGRRGLSHFLPAVHHACLCQSEGGRIVKELVPGANAGTTFSCAPVEPKKEKPIHQEAAKRIDVLLNRLFVEPLFGMGYPWKDLPFLKKIEKYMKEDDEKKMVFNFDFIGIQNYFRVIGRYSLYPPLIWANEVKAEKRDVPLTAMKWEIHPEGLYKILKKMSAYPIKNFYITENGAAFNDIVENGRVHDGLRIAYFKDYIAQMLRAKEEGIPVKGYLAWTLMDNFEWAEGFSARFGIVYNDFSTQERIIKDSGLWFKEFLHNK